MDVRRMIPTSERASVADEAKSSKNDETDSYDGRRKMTNRGEHVGRKLRVLSQFMYSRLVAEKVSIDVKLRVYKGADKEYAVRMEKPVNYDDWIKKAAKAVGYENCVLRDAESGAMLLSGSAVSIILLDFAQLELTRKLDVVTTWTERALSRLNDTAHPAQMAVGAHEVWELACRVENHAVLQEFAEVFYTLKNLVVDDRSFDVRSTAAAALLTMSEVSETLHKMPIALLTEALLESATRESNNGDDPERVVWIIGALVRFAATDLGRAAFVAAGGVRAVLPLIRAPEEPVRRAAVILVHSSVLGGERPVSAAEVIVHGVSDLIALASGTDDALPVRSIALYVVAHAIRRLLQPGLTMSSAAAALRELLPGLLEPLVTTMRSAQEMVAEVQERAGPGLAPATAEDERAQEQAEQLLEGAMGAVWSIGACLHHLGTPLALSEQAMEILLPSALAPSSRALGVVAAGVLSCAAPDPALVDVAGGGGVAPRLFTLLEAVVARAKMTRRLEVLGAAVANWVTLPSEHNAMLAENGLARALAVCSALVERVPASAHTSRAAMLKGFALSLHTALAYTAMQLAAGDALSTERRGARVGKDDLRRCLELLDSTRVGAVYAAAALFGLVRASHPRQPGGSVLEHLGGVGGVEALSRTFRSAVEGGKAAATSSVEHTLAHFTSAALWCLAHDESNATRLTRVGADIFLEVSQGLTATSQPIQTMAIGVLANLIRVHYLTGPLVEEGAAETLVSIGTSSESTGTQRCLAATALHEVSMRDEFRLRLLDATDRAMVTMATAREDDGDEEMQMIACRALARTSFLARKRKLLEMGATRALLAVAKAAESSVELRELALNGLLNLSGDEKNQIYIAKNGIFHLTAMLHTPQSEVIANHVSGVLGNLALNQANRSLMYRAELMLKHARWAGYADLDPDAAAEGRPRPLRTSGPDSPLSDEEAEGMGSPTEGEGGEGGGGAKGGGGARRADAKRRYMQWVDEMLSDEQLSASATGGRPGGGGGGGGHLSKPRRSVAPSSPPGGGVGSRAEEGSRASVLYGGARPSTAQRPTSPLGGGGRKHGADKSLPQLMCKPFHESWKVPGAERAHALPPLELGLGSTSGSRPHTGVSRANSRPHTGVSRTSSGDVGGARGASPAAGPRSRLNSSAQPGSSLSRRTSRAHGEGAEGDPAELADDAGTGPGGPDADILVLAEEDGGERSPVDGVDGGDGGGALGGGGADGDGGADGGAAADGLDGGEIFDDEGGHDAAAAAGSPATADGAAAGSADEEGMPLPGRLSRPPSFPAPRAPIGEAPPAQPRSPGAYIGYTELDGTPVNEHPNIRWFPPVVDVDMPKSSAPAPKEFDPDKKARFLRVKGRAERPFTIKLDPQREYATTWKFKPIGEAFVAGSASGAREEEVLPPEPDALKGTMVAWRGRKGSRYSRGLFAQIPLPDGHLAHVYYRGHRKNAIDPGEAPLRPMPTDLSKDFGFETLPIKPHAPPPSRRDAPIGKLQLSLSAPVPDRHCLPVEDDSVWFGTVPHQSPLFDVEQRAAVDIRLRDEKKGEHIKQWTVDDSLFAPRKKYSDARSYWNSDKATMRSFELDWARMNQERFRVLINKEDDLGGDEEMLEIKEVLEKNRNLLYACYSWYATTQRSYDYYVWGSMAFTVFFTDCKIPDKDSPYCKTKDLDNLFILQNVEEQAEYAAELNKVNPDRALMRFEFFQILVRIAIEKFVRPGHIRDVSEALEKLIDDYVIPNLPNGAKIDTDVFRDAKVYTKPCDDTLRKYLPSLKAIYKHFAAVVDDVRQRNQVMSADEWVKFCQRAQLIDETFTKREAHLCYAWSQTFVTDEIRRREKLISMFFPDFLEALCRVTCFKAMPTDQDLFDKGVKTCAAFIDEIVREGSLKHFNAERSVDWMVEQEEGRAIEDSLDKLLNLIVSRLDTDGTGNVEERDFKIARG